MSGSYHRATGNNGLRSIVMQWSRAETGMREDSGPIALRCRKHGGASLRVTAGGHPVTDGGHGRFGARRPVGALVRRAAIIARYASCLAMTRNEDAGVPDGATCVTFGV